MEKLIYWIKRMLKGNNRYCNCWCCSCRHYKKCKMEGFRK